MFLKANFDYLFLSVWALPALHGIINDRLNQIESAIFVSNKKKKKIKFLDLWVHF